VFTLRSPWSPLVLGTVLLLLGLSAWQFSGGHLWGRVLITLSLPLLYEGGAWFGAAKVGRLYYDVDERLMHSQAYDPVAAFVRCSLLYALLLSILIAGEAEVFPRGVWTWAALAVTMLLWIAYVVRSYAQQITKFARQKDLPLRGGR